MNFKDITGRLSEGQKKRLMEAKTKEDLKGIKLSDEELIGVAGGGGCFEPVWTCEKCGFGRNLMDQHACTQCGESRFGFDFDEGGTQEPDFTSVDPTKIL